MNLFLTHIFRTIRKNWLPVLLEVLSLTLAVSVAYIALNASSDVLEATRETSEAYSSGFDISLSPEEKPSAFSSIDFGEEGSAIPVSYSAYEMKAEANSQFTEDLFCLEFFSDLKKLTDKKLLTLESGRFPKEEGEVLITRQKAKLLRLKVGEQLMVADEESGEEKAITITGILTEAKLLTNSRPDLLECFTFFQEEATPYRIFVEVKDTDLAPYAKRLGEEAKGWKLTLLEEDENTRKREHALEPVLFLLVTITIVLAVTVIASITSLLLQQRLDTFAIFRSIGASQRTVRLLLLGENLLYGLAGGLFGTVFGQFLRRLIVHFYLLKSDIFTPIKPSFVVFSLFFGIVVQLGVTYGFIFKTAQTSISLNIREKGATRTPHFLKTGIWGVCLLIVGILLFALNTGYAFSLGVLSLLSTILGAILLIPSLAKALSDLLSKLLLQYAPGSPFLAMRNVGNTRHILSSITLITLVIALTLVIVFTIFSVKSFFVAYEKNYDFDIYIKGIDLTEEEALYVKVKEGVKEVRKEYSIRKTVSLNGVEKRIRFVKRGGYISGIQFINASSSDLKQGQIIMDALLAREAKLRVGDTVTILWMNGTTADFRIGGFCDSAIYDTSRSTILLSAYDYETYISTEPSRIDLKLREGRSIDDMLERLKLLSYLHLDRNISVGTKESSYGKEWEKTRNALTMLSTLPFFTLFLSLFGIVNNSLMAYHQKRRTYAVLYSVAMSRKQLCTTVLLEGVFSFFFGALFGVVLGILLSAIMQTIIFAVLAYLEIKIGVMQILLPLLLAGIIFFLVSLIPFRHMKKLKVIDEIRSE